MVFFLKNMIAITTIQFALFINAFHFVVFFYSLLMILIYLKKQNKKFERLINIQNQKIQVTIQNDLFNINNKLSELQKVTFNMERLGVAVNKSTNARVLYADIGHVNNIPISPKISSMASKYNTLNDNSGMCCNDYLEMSYVSNGSVPTNYDLNMNIKYPSVNVCEKTPVYDTVPIRTYANVKPKTGHPMKDKFAFGKVNRENGYVQMSCVSSTKAAAVPIVDKFSSLGPLSPIYEEINTRGNEKSEEENKSQSAKNSFGKSAFMPIYEEISELDNRKNLPPNLSPIYKELSTYENA